MSIFSKRGGLYLWLAVLARGSLLYGVDFQREVLPILSEHCFHCHGTDEKTREGELRLDVSEAAFRGGSSGRAAIVPGKPAQGELMARITCGDASEVMPPPSAKKPLNEAQIRLLSQWISEGAVYARHWALQAPRKVPLTETEKAENPVDALVRRKLRAAGLAGSPPAEPAALLRRIHLDLIGLPPSPRQVEEFLARAESDWRKAVEDAIERLLASEAYGERWARIWLDVARYADSNGFEKDLPREQWTWRDWVIGALNRDMPYDRFLLEQIAGDLLPGASQDQVIATGFLRNGMVNEEGAIVPEQFRLEGMFDRMDCLGKAALGLSLQCAQCHSHKFDPVSQEDYYGMFAFLNNTYEAQSWVYTAAQQQQIARIRKGIAQVHERMRQARPQWREEVAAWEKSVLAQEAEWEAMRPTELLSASGLNHPTRLDDDSVLTLGHPSTRSDVYLIGVPKLENATGLRLEALCHGDLPFGGPGFSKLGTWAITELEVHTQLPGTKDWVKQTLQNATADFAELPHRIEELWHSASTDKERNRTVGPVEFMIDGNDLTGFRADRGPGRRNTESVAVVQFAQPLSLPEGARLRVTLRTNHGGDDNGRSNVILGRCRVSFTQSPEPRALPLDYAALLAMRVPPGQRSAVQEESILAAWRAARPETKTFQAEAEKLWRQYPEAGTSVLHLAERRGEFARVTHLLDRGVWDRPKQEIRPGVPASLHPFPEGKNPDRLAFAQWLVDGKSPLAARVAVNRVWQALFGTGIVETAEDFGSRTPEPEHRELLDWLAVDFMEHGWSQKRLLRTILTSATYQQTSRVTPMLAERDPRNRLLARGPRFRADAETVRDVALSAAGLLHSQVGGPSVFPPVPQSVLDYNYVKPAYWNPPVDEQRYRRSLYLFRKRSMPDPLLSAFDAPNGDFACARRVRSNTPLAALAGWNETIFVEAAQSLALRVLRESPEQDAARTDYAFRLCLGREARPEERQAVLEQVAASRQRLARGELKGAEIAFSPLTKVSDLPGNATPNEVAAWTLAARVLLNLDETLTKN